MERPSHIACTCGRLVWRICSCCRRCARGDCWRTWWRRLAASILFWEKLIGRLLNVPMKFSDQFESRLSQMLTHYPTKRSVLVPTLLYAQDEVGYLSDETIDEIAQRLDLTELEVRNVISYYSMLTTKPRGKYNVQVCTNI